MAQEGDACIPLKGESDGGKSGYANILKAAAAAVAAINTAMAIKMADLQWDIAKDYLNISKWWRSYYNSTYRPVEDQELAEAWALAPYTPHYDTAVGRARNTARLLFTHQLDRVIQCTCPGATGLRGALLKDQLSKEAYALASMSGLGYRNELMKKDALDDRRWKRREQVLNRGRNMIANNVQYSQLAAGIFGDLGRQAAEGAGGAMYYLGYQGDRNETVYPETGYYNKMYDSPRRGYEDWGDAPPKQESAPISAPTLNGPAKMSDAAFDAALKSDPGTQAARMRPFDRGVFNDLRRWNAQ